MLSVAVLLQRLGQRFDAAVLALADGKRDAEVLVLDPPTIAPCGGSPAEAAPIQARLAEADPATRSVRFEYEGG